MTRREWLEVVGGFVLAGQVDELVRLPLGFSLYGMKSLKLGDAVKACAEIGYDGIELAVMPGWPAEPKTLDAQARKNLRQQLRDAKLDLHGLMENLTEPAADALHRANLERLKAAAELGHDVAPAGRVVIETILGGKPADWPRVKAQLVERLGDWATLAKESDATLAVKPHVSNALHTVEDAAWLMKQVNSPALRLAYDPSHFALRGVPPTKSAAALAGDAAFVHLKDAKGTPDKYEFLLPGQGDTDYGSLAQTLVKAGYRGAVVVEVSGMISNKPGYDPVAAARQSFKALSGVFGLQKPG